MNPVDYTSFHSLTAALKGQDALVSTLASTALATQLLLVEAAAKAHVKRFIPSEFGSDTLNENVRRLPVFADKIAVQDALRREAAVSGGMTYTFICSGPFLDWGLEVGFIMDVNSKGISLYDGGDRAFSTTTLATIGKTVAATLKHLEETKNRAVYVHDTLVTQKQLLAMVKTAVGEDGWSEDVVSVDGLARQAWAELTKDEPDPDKFVFNFLKMSIWGEGYGSAFGKTDNEFLGIKLMSEAEVQEVVNSQVK